VGYSVVTDQPLPDHLDELESGEFWTSEHTQIAAGNTAAEVCARFVLVFNEFDNRSLFPLKL